MNVTPEVLRYILAFKMRSFRRRNGRSLTEIARGAGISVSYLSEIENGRKFPKPEKLVQLASILGVGYEELVSPRLSGGLDALGTLFQSEFLARFPFDLFGMQAGDLLGIIPDDPITAAAFVETLLEIGQSNEMQVGRSLFTALCAYQRLNANYFPDLEAAATEYRRARGWPVGQPLERPLREVLEAEHGYSIDDATLASVDALSTRRSVHVEGDSPRLLLNPKLAPSQRAFAYAREIAFRELGLSHLRSPAWPAIRIDSFEQMLADFKASYFAGALLIDGDAFAGATEAFLAQDRWNPASYSDLMARFSASAAMVAHRLIQILPGRLDLKRMYFMRFRSRVGTGGHEMKKLLNMTGTGVPRSIGPSEHYCSRWATTRLLQNVAGAGWDGGAQAYPLISARKARFVPEDVEFFVVSAAQP
jgi:XRE family transcriptional regulator, fatty acid utilization regulator